MANEVSANQVLAPERLPPEAALSEADYRAFCAALEASARGRAFLAEYARRNRHADTETVLAALDRLEALVRRQSAGAEADRIRQELPPEVAALMNDPVVEAARAHLALVPRADEPELPIPAPAGGPAPAIALVQEHVIAPAAPEPPPPAPKIIQRSAAIIPEVNLFDGAPLKPSAVVSETQDVLSARSDEGSAGSPLARGRTAELTPPAFELTIPPPAKSPATPPVDPLAHIMALSDEERIALFT